MRLPHPVLVSLALSLTALACAPAARGSGAAGKTDPARATTPTQVPIDTNGVVDPQPNAPKCTGYQIDGVGLGMRLSEVRKVRSITEMHREESRIEGFSGRLFGFRADRPGRSDGVQVGFEPTGQDPKVVRLRATILVGTRDSWPASLFNLLGSPKSARVEEWIWADRECAASARLTRVDTLGGGSGQPYLLEITPYGR